ncbi:MAG TPA: hypothetical protein VIZ90_17415 [Rhizobiaceae bacterium]
MCHPPKAYGPRKTLYSRFMRWSRLGAFDKIFVALSQAGPRPRRIMIDATPEGPPYRG